MKKFLIASFSVLFALFLVAAVRVPSQSWFRLAGNDVVVGHVVTATNADGSGHWAAPPTGSTNFSFLFVTNTGSISNIVIPSADGEWSFYNLYPGDNLVLTNTGSGAGFIIKQTQLFSIINDVEARDAFFRRNVGVGSLTVTNGQTNSGPLVVNDNATAQNFVNPTWNDGFVLFSDGNTVTESTTLETALAVADLNTVTGALQPQLAGKVDELSGLATNLTAYGTNSAPLTSGWTNNSTFAYETLTTAGTTISSAINSSGYGVASAGFQIVQGATYAASFTLTLNSGTAPFFSSCTDTNIGGGQKTIVATNGVNYVLFTSTRSGTEFIIFWNDFGIAGNFSVANFSLVRLGNAINSVGPAAFSGPIIASGGISSPQNGTSEVFGGGGATSGTNGQAVVVGYGARAITNTYAGTTYGGQPTIVGFEAVGSGTSIGYRSATSNHEAIAIGPQSKANGLATIAIGDAARAMPTGANGNEAVIGDTMWATGNGNFLIGGGCGTAFDHIVAFGAVGGSVLYDKEIATANKQGFLGWYQHDLASYSSGQGFVNDWWLGGPVTASFPHSIALNMTSMIGANSNALNNLTINGSQGTGTGSGGNIVFATAPPGGAGSSLNARTTKLTVTASNIIAGAIVSATLGTLYPTNTAANLPTVAQIGAAGGYWVGNSNGNLVTIYTLDGSTTVMKILAP